MHVNPVRPAGRPGTSMIRVILVYFDVCRMQTVIVPSDEA